MIDSHQGPETCNTYNMLRLSKMLYETSAEAKYMEFYERALYNHILSSQHPDNGGLVYFTQMRPGHYRVYSQTQTSMWCCVGSGMENHAKYGEMIYARRGDDLFVNLFIPSRLDWKEKETEIIQENRFPDEPNTTLTIRPAKRTRFALHIRYPDWVRQGTLSVRVNGERCDVEQNPDHYLVIDRKWEPGDRVEVDLPMHLRLEQLPDKSEYYAFLYGPVALAAKTGTEEMPGLYADDSRGGHIAQGERIPLEEMPVLVGEPGALLDGPAPVPGKPLTFRLTGIYPSDRREALELIPFFRLHDSRYILYWPGAANGETGAI
jgi:DUF1680 family protein